MISSITSSLAQAQTKTRVGRTLAMAKHKYTNMVATGDWLKVNPCNAKLVAFMSKLHELENKEAKGGAEQDSVCPAERLGDQSMIGRVDKWRTVKKANLIQMHGETWHWCPHHKYPHGHFDGLYTLHHKPEDHEEWKIHRHSSHGQRDTPPCQAN